MLNDTNMQIATSPKYLRLIVNSKLDSNEHRDNKTNKCNKIKSKSKRLSLNLSRKSLLMIFKSFFRPNLGHADIISEKILKELFKRKIKIVQYKAAIVITARIKATSQDRLYQELCLEFLVRSKWSCRFFVNHKITHRDSYHQTYLNAVSEGAYLTMSTTHNETNPIPARTKAFENFFSILY